MEIGEELGVSLLDYLAWQAGCACVSDLRALDAWARERLSRAAERIPPEAAALSEWNDALAYLAGEGPAPHAEQARKSLLAALRQPGKGERVSGGRDLEAGAYAGK